MFELNLPFPDALLESDPDAKLIEKNKHSKIRDTTIRSMYIDKCLQCYSSSLVAIIHLSIIFTAISQNHDFQEIIMFLKIPFSFSYGYRLVQSKVRTLCWNSQLLKRPNYYFIQVILSRMPIFVIYR